MRISLISSWLIVFIAISSCHEHVGLYRASIYTNILLDIPLTLKESSQRELYNYQILNTVRFKNKVNKSALVIDVYDTSYNGNQPIDTGFIEYFKVTLKTKQNPTVKFLETNIESSGDTSFGYFTYSFMGSKELQFGAQAYIKCLNRELLHVEYTCSFPESKECNDGFRKMIASVMYK